MENSTHFSRQETYGKRLVFKLKTLRLVSAVEFLQVLVQRLNLCHAGISDLFLGKFSQPLEFHFSAGQIGDFSNREIG